MLFRRSFRSCSFEHVNSSGGAANVECGDFWGMAGQQSLASASGGDAAAHFRYANVARDEHLNENEFARLQPGPGAGVEMVEGSLALQLAISNWSAMTTTKLLSVSLQLFRQTNVLRCGASTTFWCSPPSMRLLAVSLVGSQH